MMMNKRYSNSNANTLLLQGTNFATCAVQVTGGRNGFGAKLTNIFSTEFIVETCDGQRGRRYKQVDCQNVTAAAVQAPQYTSTMLTPQIAYCRSLVTT